MRTTSLVIGFLLATAGASLAGAPVTGGASSAALTPFAVEVTAAAVAARPGRRAAVRAGRRVRPVRPIARPGAVVRPGLARPGRVVVVRPWRPRPHYGAFVAGVALGALVTVAVAGAAPAQPAPNVCWYWQDPARTEGYWDYCY